MMNAIKKFMQECEKQQDSIQRVSGFDKMQMKLLVFAVTEKARTIEKTVLEVYDFVYCKLSEGLSFEKMISCLVEKEPVTFATDEKPKVISAKEKRVRETIAVELRKAAETILTDKDTSLEYSLETEQVQLGDAVSTIIKITRRS